MSIQPNSEAPNKADSPRSRSSNSTTTVFCSSGTCFPNQALQPLIDELAQCVDDGVQAAVKHGILDPSGHL